MKGDWLQTKAESRRDMSFGISLSIQMLESKVRFQMKAPDLSTETEAAPTQMCCIGPVVSTVFYTERMLKMTFSPTEIANYRDNKYPD